MVKIMLKIYSRVIFIFLMLLFISLAACGKRGALERPPSDGNLTPAEVEQNN